MEKEKFLKHVDHSLLKPNLTYDEVLKGLEFARENHCASVCINPFNLDLAQKVLEGSNVKIGTVIGFPNGISTTLTKVMETKDAYARGAVEMDMVINVGALRSGDYDRVRNDIKAIVDASPAIVKVILETDYLTDEEIVIGSKLVEEAGAHYVKTSTGFTPIGATVKHIKLMRETVSDKVKVKAAGGIKTLSDALAMIEAGADRIGISRTPEMLKELNVLN
ncbi:deoxyribose-phosphate aldolase [Neobacillus mesonae]|uniref:deoxyribose-phosphate aldolase n=1 Tax=Neobacillus mesonae TaxID=1193713 RepID=UPI0020400194|nr:deoxyribose-phosphate aldolase [Neobacillus mesonae]MCM3568986.1 deoxyribose-phosphate aldolase [Neobacillus mesonae]